MATETDKDNTNINDNDNCNGTSSNSINSSVDSGSGNNADTGTQGFERQEQEQPIKRKRGRPPKISYQQTKRMPESNPLPADMAASAANDAAKERFRPDSKAVNAFVSSIGVVAEMIPIGEKPNDKQIFEKEEEKLWKNTIAAVLEWLNVANVPVFILAFIAIFVTFGVRGFKWWRYKAEVKRLRLEREEKAKKSEYERTKIFKDDSENNKQSRY